MAKGAKSPVKSGTKRAVGQGRSGSSKLFVPRPKGGAAAGRGK